MNTPVSQALTPTIYQPSPLAAAVTEGDFVHIRWSDDAKLACHRFWLRENAMVREVSTGNP